MKAVVVALFALLAVAAAFPAEGMAKAPVPAPMHDVPSGKGDLKGAESVYVASPYVAAYPAVSAYAVPAAVPAVSTYSAYSAVPAVSYGYAAAPYSYYYR